MTTAPPLIDIAALAGSSDDPAFMSVASELDAACRDVGFFSIVGHGADHEVLQGLDADCREFFLLPAEEKARIAMPTGGRAWRGWFPAGGELTSGVPDRKEGIYFGTELSPDDPRVLAGISLHGQNRFPDRPRSLGRNVLAWLEEMRTVAERVLRGLSVALGHPADFFETAYTHDPTVLFRVFRYAPAPAGSPGWGVGEHTDYGLLTLLAQDDSGGLQVRSTSGDWLDVEPVPEALVCNLGDMLELMTGGRYRSTPHRVVSPTDRVRLSFPYFFDPGFDVRMKPVVDASNMAAVTDDRWDGASPLAFEGTYGEYLMNKVSKVFPELFDTL